MRNEAMASSRPDDGSADVFVHITKIVDDGPVQAGQRVSYELGIDHVELGGLAPSK